MKHLFLSAHTHLCMQHYSSPELNAPAPDTLPCVVVPTTRTLDSSRWSKSILDWLIQNVLHSPVILAFLGFSTYLFITAPELQYQMDPLFTAARQMALRDKANYCWLSVKATTTET